MTKVNCRSVLNGTQTGFFFLLKSLFLFILSLPEILSAQELTAGIAVRQGLCNGNAGALEIRVTGGQAPYSVRWSNDVTEPVISGLTAGTYSATVTDALGATALTLPFRLEPKAFPLNITLISKRDVSCNGGKNGSAFIKAAGGTEPYTYLWNAEDWRFDEIYNLSAGSYTVTVTDAENCTANFSVTLTQPPALDFQVQVNSPSCPDCADGSVLITAIGGTAPFLFASETQPRPDPGGSYTGLAQGTYTFTVRDRNGCTLSKPVAVGFVPPPCLAPVIQTAVPADDYLNLTWNPSSVATGYVIFWRRAARNQFRNSIFIPGGNTASFTLQGLTPNQTYEIQIASRCGDELSEPGDIRIIKTLNPINTPCAVPEVTFLNGINQNAVEVEWSAAELASGYVILWRNKRNGYSRQSLFTQNITGRRSVINGLKRGRTYEIQVQARCGTRLSDPSDIREITLR